MSRQRRIDNFNSIASNDNMRLGRSNTPRIDRKMTHTAVMNESRRGNQLMESGQTASIIMTGFNE